MGKDTQKPWVVWTVGEEDFRLKLSSSELVNLEEKLKCGNLLNVIMNSDNLPPLKTMLTVVSGAMKKFNHGVKESTVYDLYDEWLEEGHSMIEFYSGIFLPVFTVSGFFSQEMAGQMQKALSEASTQLAETPTQK